MALRAYTDLVVVLDTLGFVGQVKLQKESLGVIEIVQYMIWS